jgi:hypothetical protein
VHNRTSENSDELVLLYTVHVAGQPVLAHTAAEDMKLVSSTEVTAELGYPVITKAEREYIPYRGTAQPKCCVEDILSNDIGTVTDTTAPHAVEFLSRKTICEMESDHWTLYLLHPSCY